MKMKKAVFSILAVLALVVAVGVASAQKEATFEGTLVDSKCYLKDNSLTGNDHGPVKECGTMCLKGGTPGGLLTKDKKFHAILAPSLVLAPHVGQQVRIKGSVHNGAILASKVEVNKDGTWEEVKLGMMM
jgi:hypothetical protein